VLPTRPAAPRYFPPQLPIDLTGKRALVAGVSDDAGFGFAIAKSLAEAGATICLGSWPPALGIFTKLLERGKIEDSLKLSEGRKLEFERIYPRDAAWDTMADVPPDVRENKRYKDQGDFTIEGLAARVREDFGERGLDLVVHSLANGPEVRSPLVDTSRAGYLAALSVSAYSNVALVRCLSPLMGSSGAFLSLTYLASERVIPGYGGGMSSAKAALEADTRTLAFEAGRRWGVRVNAISAGPWASRAATAIGFIHTMIEYTSANAPLPRPIQATDVGHAAAFLCSPLASAITGSVVYVDNGYHAMGMAVDQDSVKREG
jgi:enoyl-[acyl-carrier protein] reductase I